jgi:hypothetical protein
MTYALPSAPLSIGLVIDSAIRLYRATFSRMWLLALVYAGIVGVATIAWALALQKVGVVVGRTDPRQVFAALLSPRMVAGFVVTMVVSVVFYGALLARLTAFTRGDESSFGSAIAAGLRHLPGMVLATILMTLALVAGLIALIIPGLYVGGRLQLWMIVMFAEDASALDSLSRSWQLTRKRWWRAAGIFTIALILVYVLELAFGIIAGIVVALTHVDQIDQMIITQLFTVASNVIVTPLFAGLFLAMYHDFKLRSEGGDLAARVGALGRA